MLLDAIFKRYGRDPTPIEEWLDEVGAPSSLAVVFRSHGPSAPSLHTASLHVLAPGYTYTPCLLDTYIRPVQSGSELSVCHRNVVLINSRLNTFCVKRWCLRLAGFASLEDILDADLQESHLKELGFIGMKLRIRALANLREMKLRGIQSVDTPNW